MLLKNLVKNIFFFLLITTAFCYAVFLPTTRAAEQGCCNFSNQEVEFCYSYSNDLSSGKKFTSSNCTETQGTAEDTKICIDLYYNQTDASLGENDKFPIQGVRCIDNPKKIKDLQDESDRGVLSTKCLNIDKSNIGECLASSFFPNIGLPGSNEASTDPNAIRSILLARIGAVIGLILGSIGIVFLIIIIYAGAQWLIADDNEKNVAEAKERMRNAVIGLAITMFAYGLSYFIFNALASAV